MKLADLKKSYEESKSSSGDYAGPVYESDEYSYPTLPPYPSPDRNSDRDHYASVGKHQAYTKLYLSDNDDRLI